MQPAESVRIRIVGAVAVRVGDLRQRLVQDGDVVGGGVRPGAARAQQPGQRLAGVVQEAQQRVVAEGLLPRRGRLTPSRSGRSRSWRPDPAPARGSAGPPPSRPAAAPRVSAACAHANSRARGPGRPQPSQRRRRRCRPAPATRSGPRPPARTGRPGRAAPPGRRSPHRRRRASPPGRPRPGPGHDRARRCRNPASASPNASVNPVASARSASSRAPAWPTTPRPSALTVIFGRVPVAFTWQSAFRDGMDKTLRQVLSSQIRRHFPFLIHSVGQLLTKGPGSGDWSGSAAEPTTPPAPPAPCNAATWHPFRTPIEISAHQRSPPASAGWPTRPLPDCRRPQHRVLAGATGRVVHPLVPCVGVVATRASTPAGA